MTDENKPTDLESEQAALAALDELLDDPSTWAQPPAALEEQVVAAVADAQRTPQPRRRLYALVGSAAAVLLVAGTFLGLSMTSSSAVEYTAALAGTELAPDAGGEVTLTKTDSGWRIYLEVDGLPRRADGSYYEAWLKSADGVLVPVGTFNEGQDVVLWSGVSPKTHPVFTVTRQEADGNPASTGEVVVKGTTKLSD